MEEGPFSCGLAYVGHDRPEAVDENRKLTSCIFIFAEYQDSEDENFLNKWNKIICDNGGQVTQSLDDCTHLLCKTRTNNYFTEALKRGKRCVTIHWLQDVLLNSKKLQYPWKALHIPLPYNSTMMPCSSHVISVTNFEGKERTELKEMIANIGAKYTENMTTKNTILICRNNGGIKYKKALQWNIAVVNVTWINDVLLGNNKAIQLMLVLPKYQNFLSKDPFRLIAYNAITDIMHPWRVSISVFPCSASKTLYNNHGYHKNLFGVGGGNKQLAVKGHDADNCGNVLSPVQVLMPSSVDGELSSYILL